jgi:hypothetical protein
MSFPSPNLKSTGFPVAKHRSMSLRGKSKFKRENSKPTPPPQVTKVSSSSSTKTAANVSDLLVEIDLENERKIAGMTPHDIEQYQKELMAQLDPKLVAMMQKTPNSAVGGTAAATAPLGGMVLFVELHCPALTLTLFLLLFHVF